MRNEAPAYAERARWPKGAVRGTDHLIKKGNSATLPWRNFFAKLRTGLSMGGEVAAVKRSDVLAISGAAGQD